MNNSQLSEWANPRASTNTSVSVVWIITSWNRALACFQCRKSLVSASSCLQNRVGMFTESLRQMHLSPIVAYKTFLTGIVYSLQLLTKKWTRKFSLLLSPKNKFHCLITFVPTIFLKDNVSEHLLLLSTFFIDLSL